MEGVGKTKKKKLSKAIRTMPGMHKRSPFFSKLTFKMSSHEKILKYVLSFIQKFIEETLVFCFVLLPMPEPKRTLKVTSAVVLKH